MGCSASHMYIPSDAKAAQINNLALATNVVLIPYTILLENKTYNSKPPTACRGCGAALNLYSILLSNQQYYNQMENEQAEEKSDIERAEEEQKDSDSKEFLKGKYYKDLKPDEVAWICEFCSVHNKLPSDTVLPKVDKEVYCLKKGEKVKQKEETTTGNPVDQNNEDETSLILCIDVSGSMQCTHEVLKNQTTQYVSRIKLITDAVLKQIQEMKDNSPNVKIGVVLFGSEVTLLGDCTRAPVSVNKNILSDFVKIFNVGLEHGEILVEKNIKENFARLESAIKKIETGGGTALGPGLLSSLALATHGKRGSKIILCTDGLANVGIGALDSPKDMGESRQFYDQIGDVAVGQGVSVSIITVKGQACNVDALAPLTDRTAGQILRVDPTDFDLSALAANKLIATNVKIKAIIHEGLAFQNQDSKNLYNNDSIFKKDIGSVSDQNEVFFEYRVKSVEELQKANINLENLNSLPLQAQITYTDLEGNEFVFVVSKRQELTKDQKEAEKGIKADIFSNYAEKQSANLILDGKIEEAKEANTRYMQMMKDAVNSNDNESNQQALLDYNAQNQQLALIIYNQDQGGQKNQAENDDVTSQLYAIKQKKTKL